MGDLKKQRFQSEIKWPLNVIKFDSQNTMKNIGKQSQHQTTGKNVNLVVHTGITYCTKDFIPQKAGSHSTRNIIIHLTIITI